VESQGCFGPSSESILLSYESPAGEEGYPGKLKVEVTYSVSSTSNSLYIAYRATTDAATPVNLTNHSYFNSPAPVATPSSTMTCS